MSEDVIRRCDFRIREGRKRVKCGQVVESGESTTFSFDGTSYSADLCSACKLRARDETPIGELIQIARPEWTQVDGAVRRLLRGQSGQFTTADVREWARKAGYEVATAGLLRQEVKDAFDKAHA